MNSDPRAAAEKALVKLARHSASTWSRIRGEAFVGETTLLTDNTVYRFVDGTFAAHTPDPVIFCIGTAAAGALARATASMHPTANDPEPTRMTICPTRFETKNLRNTDL